MVQIKKKRALFGGALHCAGVTAATAIASSASAEFVPHIGNISPNLTEVGAYNPTDGVVVDISDSSFAAVFPLPSSVVEPAGELNAYAGPFAMGVYARVDDPQLWTSSSVLVVQYFTVDVARGVYLEWDLTLADGAASQVHLFGQGVGILLHEDAGTSGSSYFILEPGVNYFFTAHIIHLGPNPGDVGFATMTWQVPAPGAFALLGLGMIGTRRRRRE